MEVKVTRTKKALYGRMDENVCDFIHHQASLYNRKVGEFLQDFIKKLLRKSIKIS